MKNTIFLRRKNKIIVTEGAGKLPAVYLATALKNIENLGYTFSDKLIATVNTLTEEEFVSFYNQLVKDIKRNIGDYVYFKPMYPNFPDQVMEASEAELFINNLLHGWTGALPNYEVEERFPLMDTSRLKVIDVSTEDVFVEMLVNLISANTSISPTDREDIAWAIHHYKDVRVLLPEVIPSKENVGYVVAELIKNEKASLEDVSDYFKTATDVLRLATALSDGDVSLAANTVFKKFKRSERRMLLNLLDQCDSLTEDMLRYSERWKRLAKVLHPFEYKGKYTKVKEAFDIVLNGKTFRTFNGKVEIALEKGDVHETVKLLKTRPGEFARRLDHLLRSTKDQDFVTRSFEEVANEVATPVLLQVMAHFKNRNEQNERRTFFPKGNVAKLYTTENNLPAVSSKVTVAVVEACEKALRQRFSNLSPLGKVYLDTTLNDYLVPFSQRSASKSLRTIVRGSKVDLPEGDTIRFFLWWKEGKTAAGHTGTVDIDLSATMYDEDFGYKEHVSYTNLYSHSYKAVHSGDIRSAPEGASEFIDIDIPSVLAHGGRYIVMSLYSYSNQKFVELPECFAGWMSRQQPGSGEIYEPSTVQDKIDLTADTTICIPVILDLKERKVIWTDVALSQHMNYYNNLESNQIGVTAMGKAFTSLMKPHLYDLFRLHAEARGTIVSDSSEADTVFSVEEGITPFDTELIMSEYLA